MTLSLIPPCLFGISSSFLISPLHSELDSALILASTFTEVVKRYTKSALLPSLERLRLRHASSNAEVSNILKGAKARVRDALPPGAGEAERAYSVRRRVGRASAAVFNKNAGERAAVGFRRRATKSLAMRSLLEPSLEMPISLQSPRNADNSKMPKLLAPLLCGLDEASEG
jgi:hypothetical protein